MSSGVPSRRDAGDLLASKRGWPIFQRYRIRLSRSTLRERVHRCRDDEGRGRDLETGQLLAAFRDAVRASDRPCARVVEWRCDNGGSNQTALRRAGADKQLHRGRGLGHQLSGVDITSKLSSTEEWE